MRELGVENREERDVSCGKARCASARREALLPRRESVQGGESERWRSGVLHLSPLSQTRTERIGDLADRSAHISGS